MRVGGTQVLRTNARIAAATARNLADEVASKRFRDDLYYRMNVVPIRLPPLRERREDIPILVRHFVNFFKRRLCVAASDFTPEAMALLTAYAWPGNVRELRNIIERVLVLHGDRERIPPESLPPEFHAPVVASAAPDRAPRSLGYAVDACERELVLDALRKAHGVQTRAAELLGTTRRILKYKMTKLNIAYA